MTKSYIAVVITRTGLLLGEVTAHKSARMGSQAMARYWAASVIRINKAAGRDPHPDIKIRESDLEPEIPTE